ncbi:uncharacterized protein B0H18DRAFT_1119154 [Fomitopsis serialis]|uniref:uncharacterized protein n=1 Tax=Fomitopsis serialis TaxID=139415 RepID=UPI002008487C|nr:uncharacterized protein B0H18DRAFT_1119154 [Neoantrodia serialis]KAH9925989.1 hypothetical protein B0H18DRAFT_1119154 [Neoantrodia serialis]
MSTVATRDFPANPVVPPILFSIGYRHASEILRILQQPMPGTPELKDRRRRNGTKDKDSQSSNGSPREGGTKELKGSPYPSSTGSGSASRSVPPSPTGSAPPPPARLLDKDDGVAEALSHWLRSSSWWVDRSRRFTSWARSLADDDAPQSPAVNAVSRITSDFGINMKRSCVESINSMLENENIRCVFPQSGSGRRPSPVPSQLPEARGHPLSDAPALPTMLPPHPRLIGAGHAGTSLPPIKRRKDPIGMAMYSTTRTAAMSMQVARLLHVVHERGDEEEEVWAGVRESERADERAGGRKRERPVGRRAGYQTGG